LSTSIRERLPKLLISFFILVVLSVKVWFWMTSSSGSGSSEGAGLWGRLWEGIVSSGFLTLVFASLKKMLETPSDALCKAGDAVVAQGDEDGTFLDLSIQQWLSLLIALFIPILMVSLLSCFLIRNEVHLWITGPLLSIIGSAIAVLSWKLNNRHSGRQLGLGIGIGLSVPVAYALTFFNPRWVLLFYTLVIILPTLQLFMVARRGTPAIHLSKSLLAGIGMIGLVLVLGIISLPNDDLYKQLIVGRWQEDEGRGFMEFTPDGTMTIGNDLTSYTARYHFADKDTIKLDSPKLTEKDKSSGLDTITVVSLTKDKLTVSVGDLPTVTFHRSRDNDKESAKREGRPRIERHGGLEFEITPVAKPSERKPLDKRLVGKWELVEGGDRHAWIDYDKTTVEITTKGTVVFSERGKYNEDDREAGIRKGGRYEYSFTGKAWALEDGTLEFVVNDEAFRISPDFVSDSDLLLADGKGLKSGSLQGKWRRVK
jgi:hypothetical protein